MGFIKKFQCQLCQGIVETEYDDEYLICGHCESACLVPKDFGPGVVIDDFVIVNLLGEGGMGNVYLAHQFTLDRKVALKILKDDFLKDPKFKDEFIYEARSVASLNHPNIIQAYKVGEEGGVVFFAMEYVEGRNLKDILKEEGTINEKLAISIAMEIVEALGYGWNLRKLVHRDIKPENIMMTNDGTAKLMDLGLSLRDGDNKDEGDMIAGTPQYISPEQILGTEMDIRGDFYCLGATLYHLVSGKLPFEGNLQEIVKQHLSQKPPSLRKLVPGIDDFFAKIIHKMMSKKPENRYDCADSLLADFRKDMRLIEDAEQGKKHFRISTQTNIKAATQTSGFTRKKKKDPLLVASLVMLFILIGGFLVIKMFMGSKPAPTVKTQEKTKISGNSGSQVTSTPVSQSGLKLVQGLVYKYYHDLDPESNSKNPFSKLKYVETGVTDRLFVEAPDKRGNNYGIVYEGFIDIKGSETIDFYLKADDYCNVSIGDVYMRSTNGKEAVRRVSLNKGIYPVRIQYYQNTGGKFLDLMLKSITYDKQKLPDSWFTLSPDPEILLIDKSKPGLKFQLFKDQKNHYFHSRIFPDEEGVMDKPGSWTKEKLEKNYVITFDGLFKVPKPGKYKFYLKSPTRTALRVNGIKYMEDGQSLIEVELYSNVNMIEIVSYFKSEGEELLLEIEGEDLKRQEIPADWYFQQLNSDYWKNEVAKRKAAAVKEEGNGSIGFKYFNNCFKELEEMRRAPVKESGKVDDLTVSVNKINKNYSILFTGGISVPGDDEYTFSVTADDRSTVYINGKKVTGFQRKAEKSTPVFLKRGTYPLEVFYEQRDRGRSLKLYVESKRIRKTKVPGSWLSAEALAEVSATVPEKTAVVEVAETVPEISGRVDEGILEQGLSYSLYQFNEGVTNLDEALKGKVLVDKKDCVKINMEKDRGDLTENYALVYEGYIKLPEAETHKILLESNDGSRLYLDGKLLIDNDGTHKVIEKSGEFKAAEGIYKFRLEYFQQNLESALEIYREEKPGSKKRFRSSSFYRLKAAAVIEEGAAIEPCETINGKHFENGLQYTLYKSSKLLKSIEQMLGSEIIKKDTRTQEIDIVKDADSYKENYGLDYRAYLKINKDDAYTFSITSNDDTRLYLGEQLIIDNSENRKVDVAKTISVKLKKGMYLFRVLYYQDDGDRHLDLKWDSGIGRMVPVYAHKLFLKK